MPGIKKVAVEAISQYRPCTFSLHRGQAGPLEASCQQLHEVLEGNSCPGHLLGKGQAALWAVA